jgi:flavorubredoxin
VAVIDTVKIEFSDEFFARLESVARYDEIRAIVLNHLEPDHSGALPELMRRAPQAELILSNRAPAILRALVRELGAEPAFTTVDDGDSLDLGGRTLAFWNTPYLHWPDTQCTFLQEDGILFSGDVFGCHFCDDRLWNDTVGDFRFSFNYYYQHIMRPFRAYVLEALDKLEPLAPRMIVPAHGPLLRRNPREYMARYRRLATPELERASGEKSLLIFYASAYGHTARMARAVAEGAEEVAGVRVSLYDLQMSEVEQFVDLIEEADGVVFGSPTLNADAVKPVWDLLSSLTLVNVKGKIGAAFGSYGWSGEAVGLVEDRLRGLKMRVPVKGLRVKLNPTDGDLDTCRELGRELAGQLTGAARRRVIDMSELV